MAEKQNTTWVRWTMMLVALAGLAIMAYLTYIHYAEAQSFCDLSSEVSCDVVTTSIYSEVFGIPMSVLGVLYFGLMLVMSWRRPSQKLYQGLFLLTVFVLIPSLYLTLTEILFIKSFCILCESSKVLMLALLGLTFAGASPVKDLGRTVAPVLIAGVVISGVVFFAQSGTIVQEDHSELVTHLNEEGWVYYKSYTCSNCRRQERLLGDAYEQINSIECHPDGPGGQPELCLAKDIDKTPTWLLLKDGEEAMRLEGVQSINDLVEVSGFVPEASGEN